MDLNSAGFGHMFPYSNIHELNIDWLLVTVKEMEAKVVSLEGRIAEAEQRIEDHEDRMQLLETEVATLKREWYEFKQYVENRFDELEQNIRNLFIELEAMIDAQFAQLEAEIDTKFTQLEHDINDQFTNLESELRLEIQNALRYIIDTCAEFTAKVTALEGRVAQIESDMQDCCITISGKLDEVLDALDQINPELREKVITQNGVYLAADEGTVGFWKVTVNVDTGTSVLVPLEVTANGTYNPETGTDGFSSVVVNVPQAGFTTQEKTATENGVVTPDAGYDGLSKVTVDVPQRAAEALTITQNGTTQTPAGKYYDPITVNVDSKYFAVYRSFGAYSEAAGLNSIDMTVDIDNGFVHNVKNLKISLIASLDVSSSNSSASGYVGRRLLLKPRSFMFIKNPEPVPPDSPFILNVEPLKVAETNKQINTTMSSLDMKQTPVTFALPVIDESNVKSIFLSVQPMFENTQESDSGVTVYANYWVGILIEGSFA